MKSNSSTSPVPSPEGVACVPASDSLLVAIRAQVEPWVASRTAAISSGDYQTARDLLNVRANHSLVIVDTAFRLVREANMYPGGPSFMSSQESSQHAWECNEVRKQCPEFDAWALSRFVVAPTPSPAAPCPSASHLPLVPPVGVKHAPGCICTACVPSLFAPMPAPVSPSLPAQFKLDPVFNHRILRADGTCFAEFGNQKDAVDAITALNSFPSLKAEVARLTALLDAARVDLYNTYTAIKIHGGLDVSIGQFRRLREFEAALSLVKGDAKQGSLPSALRLFVERLSDGGHGASAQTVACAREVLGL